MDSFKKHLKCLKCKSRLIKKKSSHLFLSCEQCQKKYLIKNNRIIFTDSFENFQGKLPLNPTIIQERLNPTIVDFTYIMTKSYRKTIEIFKNKVLKQKKSPIILDLGCGYKPFKQLFPQNSQYIGVDISLNSYADIVADNHHLPFKDNTFDAVIASEVLEHSVNEYQFIDEIKRVCKNSGLIFLSLPFIFPEHGAPHDFQRFTKYKLKELFKKDKIIQLQESNNFLSSVFVFINIFFKSVFGNSKLFYPVYIINNLLILLSEKLAKALIGKKGFIGQHLSNTLKSCPIGYSLIIKINK